MLHDVRVVALIPARGGSKSIPYKNLRPLGGRPLLAWPIETALATPEIDRVIVSSDDEKILDCARKYGAEAWRRPEELASDSALVADSVRHVNRRLRAEGETAEIMTLLEATSPFRTPGMIRRCLERMIEEDLDSIATFHAADVNPWRTWRISGGIPSPFIEGAVPWLPRQQLPEAYQLNGAVYAFRPDRLPPDSPRILFGRIGALIVAKEEVIDIDDKKDFTVAETLLQSRTINEAG